MLGVCDVQVISPSPAEGVARSDGPIDNTLYEAAAPVKESVRVRGTDVVVVDVAVGGAGEGADTIVVVVVVVVVEGGEVVVVVVVVVVVAAMVTVVDLGEPVSVL